MDEKYCVTCKKECRSHSCNICGYPCHPIEPCCKIGEEENEENEEGYDASVTRITCSTKGSSEGPHLPSKATKLWNWKGRRSTPPSVPAKKMVDKDKSSGEK